MQQHMTSPIKAWKTVVRLRTLPIPTIQVLTATALAYITTGHLDFLSFLYTWLIAICVTIGTNLMNDFYDFEKGGDPAHRLGYLKVIPAGLLSKNEVFKAGVAAFAIAIALSIPLAASSSPWIIPIVFLSTLCGFAYTGGPYPIGYLGLSELFVFLFYGGVCVLTSYYIQVGRLDPSAWLLAVQMGLLAILPNAVNNFRDMFDDAEVNKKTLAVRFGKTFARSEIAFCTFVPFVLNFAWIAYGHAAAALFPLCAFPLAFLFVKSLWNAEPSAVFNRYFALSVLIHFLFGLLLCIGWVIV
jgi:1,4-dihydroxy-2-naphthoate octaprenyltransferase